MHAIGIVAEYNPFHNGHQLHINETKKTHNLPVIAVMSGSFMQRGEPAFADKWLRAHMAIAGGVDLVLELPTAFSLRSAQYFAQGSVKLLEATGLVSYLSCGAETADIDFRSLAKLKMLPVTQEKIHAYVKQGMPYAQACALALGNEAIDAFSPNNILALEYAKALLDTNIEQIVIPRVGSSYNSTTLANISSATAIRHAYNNHSNNWQQSMPSLVVQLLQDAIPAIGYKKDILWLLLSYQLRNKTPAQIAGLTLCNEGLENLLKLAAKAQSLEEAVALCISKRYPASHIRRLLLQLLLDKPRAYFKQPEPAYIRVLAFNNTGRSLLSKMKQTTTLPIITKLGKNPFRNQTQAFQEQLELDIAASDIVSLLRPNPQPPASDFLTAPIYYQ